MANGTVRITDKPTLDSIRQADKVVVVKSGKVYQAPPDLVGDVSLIDQDDSDKEYVCTFTAKNGHLVFSMTPAT